ncbi:hypothetical protein EVA_10068 [gut metagenome]|uniref:Peptidase U32 collagenase domain-containing protein n=1 Tax=gut metagenome TaxID=749906 RepID=J9CNX7_9ZZZZ
MGSVNHIEIELCENPFIPNKVVNELRRMALEQLDLKRAQKEELVELDYDFKLDPVINPQALWKLQKKNNF